LITQVACDTSIVLSLLFIAKRDRITFVSLNGKYNVSAFIKISDDAILDNSESYKNIFARDV